MPPAKPRAKDVPEEWNEDYQKSDAYRELEAKLATDQIVIERREIIEVIKLTDTGEYPPMLAAFMMVSNYLEGNLEAKPITDRPMSLEFKYGPHTFHITAEFTG
jgi:hypothetical protein